MKEEEIKFIILPNNTTGKVKAEIYVMVPNHFILHEGQPKEVRSVLLEKEFGSNWVWVLPTKEDYDKAREWVEDQIEYIKKANKPLQPTTSVGFRKTYKEEVELKDVIKLPKVIIRTEEDEKVKQDCSEL